VGTSSTITVIARNPDALRWRRPTVVLTTPSGPSTPTGPSSMRRHSHLGSRAARRRDGDVGAIW
jgi:hypothetical protein